MVGLALYLANQVLGAELPREAKHLLKRERAIPTLASRVGKNLFDPGKTDFSEDPLFFIRCMDADSDRLRYLAFRLFAPTPWLEERVRLPSSLFFLYYLIRPLELLRQYGIPRLRFKRHGNRSF